MKKITSFIEEQPCAIFSLSMTEARLTAKLIAEACVIDEGKLISGELSPEEQNQVNAYAQHLQDLPVWIDDTPALSLDELKTRTRQLVREHNVKAIYIDDMRFLEVQGASAFSSEETEKRIKEELESLSKELAIPICY